MNREKAEDKVLKELKRNLKQVAIFIAADLKLEKPAERVSAMVLLNNIYVDEVFVEKPTRDFISIPPLQVKEMDKEGMHYSLETEVNKESEVVGIPLVVERISKIYEVESLEVAWKITYEDGTQANLSQFMEFQIAKEENDQIDRFRTCGTAYAKKEEASYLQIISMTRTKKEWKTVQKQKAEYSDKEFFNNQDSGMVDLMFCSKSIVEI